MIYIFVLLGKVILYIAFNYGLLCTKAYVNEFSYCRRLPIEQDY